MSAFEMENATKTIIHEITVARLKQVEVAKTCALAMMTGGVDSVDWKAVNAAIVGRWSRSGRERVLGMAWKIIEQAKGGER